MTSRNAIALWLVATIVLGVAGLFRDGLAVALVAGSVLVLPSVWWCRRLDRSGALGLVPILMTAVTLRWVVSSGINYLVYPTHPVLFAPDEFIYDYSGW